MVGEPGPQRRLERLLPGRRPVQDTERRHPTTAWQCFGERVAALGEQQPHLLAGHRTPDVEAVDAGQLAADPPARRLTTPRVVAGQIRPAPMRRVERRHLADQIDAVLWISQGRSVDRG